LVGIVDKSETDDIVEHFEMVGLQLMQVTDVLLQDLELLLHNLQKHIVFEGNEEVVDNISNIV
jgi:hypothetical protein